MPAAYLAAVTPDATSPADRASLCTFIPCSRWDLTLAIVFGAYAHARWRNKAATAVVAFAGFKVPVLTGILLAFEAMKATRRKIYEET
jgi:hypothetical protein